MDEITAVLIDDHPAVRAGVASWFHAVPERVRLVDNGPTPAVAWQEPGRSANVVVLDLHLNNTGPAYADLRALVRAERNVVVYSMSDHEDVAITCVDMGACTFLTKVEGESMLIDAIEAAASGRPFIPPGLAGAFSADRRPNRPELAPRELEVLIEWFQCESKALVAERLGLSVRTVNSYLDRVRIKYANVGRPASTKANLVARAVQDGLVALDDL